MGRTIQVMLGLGLAGLWLVGGAGSLGQRRPSMTEGPDCSRLARLIPSPPQSEAAQAVVRQAPKPIVAQEGVERQPPSETLPVMVPRVGGPSSRLPAWIAPQVQRQNLEIVVEKYARQYGVDQALVLAVMRQESGFNPRAVSPKGAMGLMQLMPGTAAMLGVVDAFDVEQNIAGGIKYLERCLSQFNQDVSLALAAYNAGPENVVKYQGCPPFAETRHYVAGVLSAYAGEAIREDRRRGVFSPVMAAEVPAAVRLPGLAWRVPGPRWRIAAPQCTLGSPRWKAAPLPF